MISGRRGMIAVMMLHASSAGDLAMANHVGMRHAVGRGLAVTECEHGRRRHEAKRGEGREQNRKPEVDPGSKGDQHEVASIPPMPDRRLEVTSRNPRGHGLKQAPIPKLKRHRRLLGGGCSLTQNGTYIPIA